MFVVCLAAVIWGGSRDNFHSVSIYHEERQQIAIIALKLMLTVSLHNFNVYEMRSRYQSMF